MDKIAADKVLDTLEDLRSNHEISIIKLSEPITSSDAQDENARQRTSDASNAPLEGPSPASLEADLEHYTELFAKLRFSYVEQVTKEKFIRAIVGDPPLIVTMQENLELEKENVIAKGKLKALKTEVAAMVKALEVRGRELSKKYENIQLETSQLQELPDKCAELQAQVKELRAQQDQPEGSDPNLHLPLGRTQDLITKRKMEQQELDRELEALRSKVPRKMKEAERLQHELQPLETKRQNSMAAAKEAQRRKEASLGGAADDLEQRARWWKANEAVLKQLLDIQG